jgi:hypothetical protein
MRLRYEDILTNTSGQLKRVCDFLEIGFEKEMIEYWKQKHHLVAGNRGTVSFIRRAHGMDFDAVDKPFYAQQDPYSFQDHRWSNELTAYHLYLFEKIGGDLNRDYGYLSSQQPVGFPEAVHYGLRRRMRFLKRILMPPVSFNYRTTTRIVHNILRVRSE